MLKRLKTFSFKTLALLVAVPSLALAFVPASSTQAASNPYTAAGVCNSEAPGGNYYVQRSHDLNGARVYQLYNGTYNCVVTIKTSSVGTQTLTNACIRVTGKGWNCNEGNFTHYAGAVWYNGQGKCVQYFGYHGGDSYESPWGNCS